MAAPQVSIPHLRLLSLDGGGVRGLASLIVLKKLLAMVGAPKPCQFFDMICGTSTGGLIAIMLGILEMSIDDCIEVFTSMMAKVFVNKRVLPFYLLGRVKGRYSTAPLEKCIADVLAEHGKAGHKMREHPNPSCKVIVLAMEKSTSSSVCFTNYGYPGDGTLFENITILDAALATTAASTFFGDKEITVAGVNRTRTFIDAALGENNPVRSLYTEAIQQYGSEVDSQILCLLSLGTGVPPTKAFGSDIKSVGESILEHAKETGKTALNFRDSNPRLTERGAYFRFSPPDIYHIRIDDSKMGGDIEGVTEHYLKEVADQVRRFTRHNGPNSTSELDEETESPQTRPPPAARLFHTLSGNARYLCRDATYWRHLTLEGYQKYQAIYENCKPTNRSVSFPSFKDQFRKYRGEGYDPPAFKLEEVWKRVARDGHASTFNVQQSSLQKDLIMATLYMLHVETSVHTRHDRPAQSNGEPGIDSNRREVLKRFSKWVSCRCAVDCGKEWNFVNDVGLGRPEGYARRCKVVEILAKSGTKGIMPSAKSLKLLEVTRNDWYKATL